MHIAMLQFMYVINSTTQASVWLVAANAVVDLGFINGGFQNKLALILSHAYFRCKVHPLVQPQQCDYHTTHSKHVLTKAVEVIECREHQRYAVHSV